MKKTVIFFIKSIAFFVLILFGESLNAHSLRPIPWITTEAVNFLEKFMLENPDASVLEFGSGASTIWFAKRTRNLVSVEHNLNWYNDVRKILENEPECNYVNLIFHKRPYYLICNEFPLESFDLILVDGRNRKGCIVNSIPLLKSGGVLMLDNAERHYYNEAVKLLKSWKTVKSVQKKPDACGFIYPNWQTHWFIKP